MLSVEGADNRKQNKKTKSDIYVNFSLTKKVFTKDFDVETLETDMKNLVKIFIV